MWREGESKSEHQRVHCFTFYPKPICNTLRKRNELGNPAICRNCYGTIEVCSNEDDTKPSLPV
jgi:hypothetical protein